MPLKDYEEFAAEPLAFPIGGKLYTVTPLGILDGLTLSAILSGKDESRNDEAGEGLWKLALGPVWDAMLADNVPSEAAARAGFSALADFQYGRETAERIWESGIDPEARAAMTAALRGLNSTSSPDTASESPTPSPADTSITTSPKATRPRKPRASAGSKSSNSGS